MSISSLQFVFEVISHQGVMRSGQQWSLADGEGRIGRGDDCDLMLPDESRIISRVHATVRHQGEQCVWTDLGANPSVIDGRSLAAGEPCLLRGGEKIQIGDYQLSVAVSACDLWEAPERPLPDDLDFLNVPPKTIDDIFQDLGGDDLVAVSHESAPDLVPNHPLSEPVFLAYTNNTSNAEAPTPKAPVISEQTPLEKGLGLPVGQHLSADHEQLAGALLRTSLDGLLQMLWSRKVFRNEMGASFTEILASKNNPLKFSMDVDEALERLLLKSHPAFMPPVEAVSSAVNDLLQHNASALSGLQEALNTALHALDPEAVEAAAQRRNGTVDWLSVGVFRKARLWRLYCERYREIGRRPQDDPLNRLFSDSMRAAMRKPESA